MAKKDPKAKTSLVLRACSADMTSRNGFQWPGVGDTVVCPDWIANNECGNGLHGWLYGQGDHTTSPTVDDNDAKWLVVEVISDSIIMLGGKCKFPQGVVRFAGERKEAAEYIIANEPRTGSVAVIGAMLAVGDMQSVMVGALGSATAGALGSATAGESGTATAGYRGTATAGDRGTATAGYSGTATAGYRGTATAGDSGTATAGERGTIAIRWYDNKNDRYRTVVGYVGEDGVEANVAYKLDDQHSLVKA